MFRDGKFSYRSSIFSFLNMRICGERILSNIVIKKFDNNKVTKEWKIVVMLMTFLLFDCKVKHQKR